MLTKASKLEIIGDNIEEYDDEHGNEKVRITLVQKVETKTYLVQQGKNRRKDQEILTVFTKHKLNERRM